MTATEHLKQTFPDWLDWPDGAVEATIEMMHEFAMECVMQDRKQQAEHFDDSPEIQHACWLELKALPFTFETKIEER